MASGRGYGGLVRLTGGSLALAAAIVALWTGYVNTIQAISDTDGAVVPESPVVTAIPEQLQPQVDRLVQGYEDAYFGPIRQAGEQAADPSAPDPKVVLPDEAAAPPPTD
jgi:hypothetical protein